MCCLCLVCVQFHAMPQGVHETRKEGQEEEGKRERSEEERERETYSCINGV